MGNKGLSTFLRHNPCTKQFSGGSFLCSLISPMKFYQLVLLYTEPPTNSKLLPIDIQSSVLGLIEWAPSSQTQQVALQNSFLWAGIDFAPREFFLPGFRNSSYSCEVLLRQVCRSGNRCLYLSHCHFCPCVWKSHVISTQKLTGLK